MAPRKGLSDCIARIESGRWKLRIVINGRVIKRTFSTKTEAERVRDNLRGREKLRSLGVPLAQRAALVVPTVGSVLDAYVRECETLGRSEAHLRSIRQAKAMLVEWGAEHREAGDLKRADLVEFIGWAKRTTKSKGRTIHNALVILRTAIKLADLPVPSKPRIELPSRHGKTFPKAEVEKLLAALPLGSVARTAVEIGLRTAARETEIRRIRVGDVDLERRTLVLRRGKGKAGRRGSEEAVPIPEGLVRVLRAYQMLLPPDLADDAPFLAVMSRPRKRVGPKTRNPLRIESLRRILAEACTRAGISTRSTVGWTRAQAVTLSREAGMALSQVSTAAGHADERVTRQHYDESTREVSERWEARKQVGAEMDNLLPFAPGGKDGYALGTPPSENAPESSPDENGKSLETKVGPVAQVDRAAVS